MLQRYSLRAVRMEICFIKMFAFLESWLNDQILNYIFILSNSAQLDFLFFETEKVLSVLACSVNEDCEISQIQWKNMILKM